MMISTTKNPLPAALLEAYATGTVHDPTGKARELQASVSQNECQLLYESVRHLRPEVTVEVGMGSGLSTQGLRTLNS